VDIDITYACTLRFYNCNRSCGQQPTADLMSVGQLNHFLEEIRSRQIRWRLINLVGGDTTCHPHFQAMVDLVLKYCEEFSPDTCVKVFSNRYSARTKKLLSELPSRVLVDDSAKTSSVQTHHTAFNVAPIDVRKYMRADFSNGCSDRHPGLRNRSEPVWPLSLRSRGGDRPDLWLRLGEEDPARLCGYHGGGTSRLLPTLWTVRRAHMGSQGACHVENLGAGLRALA
jgi:hypothetical protein